MPKQPRQKTAGNRHGRRCGRCAVDGCVDGACQDKGTMRVAFGDMPGGEMVNFMVAVERAKEQGVKVETVFLNSENWPPRPSCQARPTSASAPWR